MSIVVPQQVIDKNGKQTTVKKKIGEAPKPTPRPMPAPLARVSTVTNEQRNSDAVRDLFSRLNVADFGNSEVREIDKGIYAVDTNGTKRVAFDAVHVADEVVSGVIFLNEGNRGVGGSLYLGSGISNQTDTKGYAINSTLATEETYLDAVQIALPHLS